MTDTRRFCPFCHELPFRDWNTGRGKTVKNNADGSRSVVCENCERLLTQAAHEAPWDAPGCETNAHDWELYRAIKTVRGLVPLTPEYIEAARAVRALDEWAGRDYSLDTREENAAKLERIRLAGGPMAKYIKPTA